MSNGPRQPPQKKDVALEVLERSSMFIHLDPRRPDVVVPRWFAGQPQLVLQVGLNMAIPIPDLKVDDIGISCTLSFSRSPFWCKIPWSAIYALIGEDGRGGVWPDDVPPEVPLQARTPGPQKPAPAKRPRPKLAAVGSEPEPASQKEAAPEPAPEEQRPRPVAARQGPVAVPPPREEASEPDEGEAPAEPSPSPSKGKKGKREIPPYLRVIK
jgi:hypothetical protein